MILIFIFSVLLIAFLVLINYLSNNGYLSDKQYRIYFIIFFIGFLFLCGQIEKETNKPNKYNNNSETIK